MRYTRRLDTSKVGRAPAWGRVPLGKSRSELSENGLFNVHTTPVVEISCRENLPHPCAKTPDFLRYFTDSPANCSTVPYATYRLLESYHKHQGRFVGHNPVDALPSKTRELTRLIYQLTCAVLSATAGKNGPFAPEGNWNATPRSFPFLEKEISPCIHTTLPSTPHTGGHTREGG